MATHVAFYIEMLRPSIVKVVRFGGDLNKSTNTATATRRASLATATTVLGQAKSIRALNVLACLQAFIASAGF